ncbi:hypothetical protein D3C81_1219400 [compost metagenome]
MSAGSGLCAVPGQAAPWPALRQSGPPVVHGLVSAHRLWFGVRHAAPAHARPSRVDRHARPARPAHHQAAPGQILPQGRCALRAGPGGCPGRRSPTTGASSTHRPRRTRQHGRWPGDTRRPLHAAAARPGRDRPAPARRQANADGRGWRRRPPPCRATAHGTGAQAAGRAARHPGRHDWPCSRR